MFIELNVELKKGNFSTDKYYFDKRLININSIDFVGDNFIQIGKNQLKTKESYEEIYRLIDHVTEYGGIAK